MDLPVPVDDFALLAAEPDQLARAIIRSRSRSATGSAGRLAIRDDRLVVTARAAGAEGPPIDILVVTTGGAGGLLTLDPGRAGVLQIAAVESTIRDLSDPVANAARILAAAEAAESALGHELDVYVGLPAAPGWEAAAQAVEASGRSVALTAGPDRGLLAGQLSALIELDCPFAVRLDGIGPWSVLIAVEALIEGANVGDAAALLSGQADPPSWDGVTLSRVKRRISRLGLDLAGSDVAP